MSILLSIAHKKGFTLSVEATISEAMVSMLNNNSGTVVLLKNNKPVGIVTESHLVKKITEGIDLEEAVYTLAEKKLITIFDNADMESAFDLIVSNNIRRLIMIDERKEFCGVILQKDLFNFLEKDVYKINLKVRDLLSNHRVLITLSKNRTIQEASFLMSENNIGSVIISNHKDEAIGIITEKDILQAGYQKIDMSDNVQKIMSSPLISIHEDDAIVEVVEMMKKSNFRHILVRNQEGKITTLLTNRDIFQHIKGNVARMLEIKLHHAKEAMDLLPEAIIEIFDSNTQQRIHWMNSQAKELFGEGLINQSPQEFMGEDAWRDFYKRLNRIGTIRKIEVDISSRNFEFSGIISKNINSSYIKLIIQDITQHQTIKEQLQNEIIEENKLRRENEYMMMQQSRMASMGEMVGHIAHQWRQPLAQLGGVLMNLESAYSFGELDEHYLEEKIKQGNELITYMSETIDDFRLFFSPNQKQIHFDLILYLNRAISIVSASLNYHHIEVQVEGEEGLFFALGLPNEFAQSMLNLLNNSRDALSKIQGKRREIFIKFSKKEDSVLILFSDNGGGIPTHILPKIFEPFVTSNQEYGGSGAGLYITRLIIEQKMGGKIEAYNNKKGACFKILL